VNGVALACLPTALADDDYVRQYVDQVRQGRELLQQELARWGIQHWRSQANFVLANFGPLRTAFVQSMRTRGILVRDRSRDHGCDGCVRITLGNTEQTNRLLESLREAVAEIEAREVSTK
jgi:histidinol-phosphate aminotransferase